MPEISELEEKLALRKESIWLKADKTKKNKIFEFAECYKKFIDECKTERQAVKYIVELIRKKGFRALNELKELKHGDRIYEVNRHKNIILAVIGTESLEKGLNIIVAHLDAPRLDLKPNPLYEDKDSYLGLFKTHYYGGIKKYHWVNIPLALYGKVIKKDGKELNIKIGEDDNEPVFVIPDLLPHLSKKIQDERKLSEGIKGEELNIIVGSIPVKDKKVKEKIKLQLLNELNKKYGLVEEDFVSAELEFVPAGKSKDVGFDCSLIGAYGQDDRICAYTSLQAILELKSPKRTCIGLFVEKEEIGSEGATGMKSMFFEDFVSRLLSLTGKYDEYILKNALANSKAISADVNGALDPSFKEVHEIANAAKLGLGVVITKHTGAGGKFMASEATAEYVGAVRNLLNREKIAWQASELGKVDEGGGGTVAKYLAEYNMDVIDMGPPILSMHSPFEISSKADIYESYRAYRAFFSSME
ncbi:MAG: aminopeptidase [Candidatus Thermoplasmatota archaeon]|nr:aminopeptidase [Candidatus Thermoplasmatota archaeon]